MGAISDGSPASAATVASVDVQPGLKNAVVGDAPFNVTVQVNSLAHEACIGQGPDCSPSVGLAAFEFKIRYDGDVVDIRSAEQGPDLGKTGREFQCVSDDDDVNDVYTFGCFSPGQGEGLQGSAVLARVQVAPVGRGNSWIDLEGELSGPYSEDIPADFKRAAVIVLGRPGDPQGGQPQSVQTPGSEDSTDPGGEPTVPTNDEGTPLSPEEVIATATAQALEEGNSASVSGDDDDPDEAGGEGGENGDDGEESSSPSGDDGGGSNFVTVLLITLGVIAGAAALGAGGFAAWRVRNGG
jgi:hypothetical protein